MFINSKFKINEVLLNQESLQKKNKYSCPICFEYFYKKSVYQCRYGHYACKKCWKKSLKIKQECMICRSEVNSTNDLSRCLVIEQNFAKKECHCIFSYFYCYQIDIEKRILNKDEKNGCKEIINVDQLDTHIQNCKYKFVECSHNGCYLAIRLNSLEEHENQCGYKLVKCKYCNCGDIIQKGLDYHYYHCPKFPISCPQSCSLIIDRCQIESHIENDCNNSIIQCKYYEYGCKVEMKRPELQNHLENVNHQYFMCLLIEKLESKLSTLSESNKTQDELVKKIGELQIKNDNLSSLITKMDSTYQPTYKNKWMIFSNLQNDTTFISQPFNFENKEFQVIFGTFPNSKTFFGFKTDTSFDFKYNLTLVNLDKSKSIKFSGPNRIFSTFLNMNEIQDKKCGWLGFDNKFTIKIFIKKLNNNTPLKSQNIFQ
ncbi:hypothetical protein ACTFIW_009005 [Dictyostelium discoideum]